MFLLFHLRPELSQCTTAPSDLPLLFMDFLSRIAIFCHKGFSPSIPVGFSSLTLYHRKTALRESVCVDFAADVRMTCGDLHINLENI